MGENTGFQQVVRLNCVDRCGRAIDGPTMEAAQAIAARAVQYAQSLISCPALATSLLEEAAAAVSRASRRRAQTGRPPVLDLQAYLFKAFIRRVNHVRKKDPLLTRCDDAERLVSGNGSGANHDVDLQILLQEFLTHCDAAVQDMFYRRMAGFSWQEIGEAHGISAHAAEARFSSQLKRVRKRLGFI